MRYLITGANGQLATEFRKNLENNSSIEVLALSKEKLDISDFQSLEELVSNFKPNVIINCAAYNNVDGAETEGELAFKINSQGPKNLAYLAKKIGSLIVHFSTDYVFDGRKEDFYTEEDEPNPISVYGKSKLGGEKGILEETDNYLIFRVSWVFGEGKQNFLHKLREWSQRNRVIKIVSDQVSIPTYTEDIVKVTRRAIDKGLRGIFHLTNSGYASRYEVARFFLECLGKENLILPVSTSFFNVPAQRPYFSAMSNKKISKILDIEIPNWKNAIERYIKRHINSDKYNILF
ncbi:MAG: dTDP-4-dehydrorhamnose reductase [Proteobacteria bacterium]|nr:dTDP-4-dehydrorhamnose reductase [Pseudomonadota bacterium]